MYGVFGFVRLCICEFSHQSQFISRESWCFLAKCLSMRRSSQSHFFNWAFLVWPEIVVAMLFFFTLEYCPPCDHEPVNNCTFWIKLVTHRLYWIYNPSTSFLVGLFVSCDCSPLVCLEADNIIMIIGLVHIGCLNVPFSLKYTLQNILQILNIYGEFELLSFSYDLS